MSMYTKFTINDVLLNKESLQKKNKYSCPICFELFYKKSIYQCSSGHYACKECWEKSLEIKQECMICRCKVKSFKNLSRCLVIEQNFAKKECYCIYSFHLDYFIDSSNQENEENEDNEDNEENEGNEENEENEDDGNEDEDDGNGDEENNDDDEDKDDEENGNGNIKLNKDEEYGCKEIINVDQLDRHIENCKFKFVKCSHNGCDRVLRLNSLEEHEEQCDFKLVKCEYCACDGFIQMELGDHHDDECPKFLIDCPNSCSITFERDQIKSHIDNDCNNSTIQCKYYEYGCKVEMERSELQNHLLEVDHQNFMGLLIDKLSSKLAESNKTQDKLVKMIDELQIKNDNLSSLITKMDGIYSKQQELNPSTYKNKWIISNFSKDNTYLTSRPFNFENEEFKVFFSRSSIFPLVPITIVLKTEASFYFKYICTLVNNLDKSKSIKFKGTHKTIDLGLTEILDKKFGWLSTDNKLTIKIFIKKLNNNNVNTPL
ncbi:hypothetical protein ACTFIW_009006 [Dictyostelium discoideum]